MLCRSTAMELLHYGVDPLVIAIRLGHEFAETVPIFIHADMRLKERRSLRWPTGKHIRDVIVPNGQLLALLKGSDYADIMPCSCIT